MKDTKQQWFKEAKYGLFIHFGLYSILAGEYKGRETPDISEWIMNTLDIPAGEYEKLAADFDPVNFDAEEIVRRAKEWGMRYIVFTAKHHDGFAMYHSKCSKYNIVDATPYKRDMTKELQAACEKHGMKFGLYYSQSQDWHHPDGFEANKDNSSKNFRKYLDEKCIPQVKELLTGYGDIALIWFDTPMDMKEEESLELFRIVKSIQPNCLVSGRIGNNIGEYMTTRDNFIPLLPYQGDWETPATINNTWGFSKYDRNWKSPDDIIRLLLKTNGRGGNYLLNIGPDALGNIPSKSVEVLDRVGEFIRLNADSIYATKRIDIYPYDVEWALFTQKDYKLFIHLIRPITRCILSNIKNNIKNVYILHSGEAVPFARRENCEDDTSWEFYLPESAKDVVNITICLELEEKDPVFTPIL